MAKNLVTRVKPEYWDEALAYLRQKDRLLSRLIDQYKDHYEISQRPAFATLARSIVGQKASEEKASAMWESLVQVCGKKSPTASMVLQLGTQGLAQCGIAKRKIDYLLDLATHFDTKSIQPAKWSKMTDQEVIDDLCKIRGIGRWTADMFLIFNLHRPNVLPLEDPRLIKAVSQHYFNGQSVSRYEIRELAQIWQPWCTVATWYMWRSLLPTT